MRFTFIDFKVQTILLSVLAIFYIVNLFTGGVNHAGPIGFCGAIFLALWQLVSSVITTVSKEMYLRWRRIYLWIAVAYLVFIAIVPPEGFGIIVIGLPVVLVLFYYYITLKSYRLAKAKV